MKKIKLNSSEYAKEAVKRIHAGMPTKYKGKEHDELLIELFSQGHGFATFCAEAMISHETYYEWIKVQPTFKAAHKLALAIGLHKWDKLALNKDIDGKRWSEIRRNRFGCLDAPRVLKNKIEASVIDKMKAIFEGLTEGDFDSAEANKLAQLVISQLHAEDRVPLTPQGNSPDPTKALEIIEQLIAAKEAPSKSQKEDK